MKSSVRLSLSTDKGVRGKQHNQHCFLNQIRGKYKRIHSYKLRSNFKEHFYKELGSMNTCIKYLDESGTCKPLYQVEVNGIPTIAWLTAHFYKKVIPCMSKGYIVVLDHYLGDYYADMLAGVDIEKFRSFVREHLAIPDFHQGIHFYLDIDDYKIYQERWRKREEKKHPENPGKRRKPPVTLKIFEERRERYQKLCELTPLICINATGASQDKIAEKVAKEIEKKWSQ